MKENNQTIPEAAPENNGEESKPDGQSKTGYSDVDLLNGIIEKYNLTVLEKKVIGKVISLIETRQMRQLIPKQNVGDSVFKMYSSEEEPTEFLVDRVEFDDYGWNLVSYEKFGTSEVEFIFSEKDYRKLFFDSPEEAKAYYHKK